MPTPESIDKDWKKVENEAQLLFGPNNIVLAPQDVIVIVRVKTAAEYIRPFIKHYLQLGVKHLFFLDNNSSDNTVELASAFEQVTVFQTQLPYKHYKMAFIHFLLHRFGQHCWSLVVDIDEFFDYPFSEVIPLPALIQYLNEHRFEAVVGQMLDLFPENLTEIQPATGTSVFPGDHFCYDLSSINKQLFHPAIQQNEWSNYNIGFHRGGVRKKWFELDNLDLTKFPLVRFSPAWTWDSIHLLSPCSVADLSCVLYHYKFRSDFIPYVEAAVKEAQYHQNSKVYKKIWAAIQEKKWPPKEEDNFQRYPTPLKLIQQNFLEVSAPYLHYVQRALKAQLTQIPPEAFKLFDQLNELLHLTIQKLTQTNDELQKSKQHQQEELQREISLLKNTNSWKIGNTIVGIIKKIIQWGGFGKRFNS